MTQMKTKRVALNCAPVGTFGVLELMFQVRRNALILSKA